MKSFKYEINKYNTRKMMIIPVILFAIAAVIVGITFGTCGLPVHPGIDFAGGTAVTIQTDDSKETLAVYFAQYDLKSIDSGIGGSHLDPEIPDVTVEKLNACLVRVVEGFFYGSFAEPVSIFEDKQAQ